MDQQIQLGKYRLYQHLATGGMGEVFLAVQEGPAGFAKSVVVKRILASVASEPAFVTMFLNEARLAALIEHPNVVQIFDLGLEGTTYFIAMEHVHGRSLRQVRNELSDKGRKMAPALAARICSQALLGLHHAHTLCGADGEPLKIVHRDVSPDNLLIGFNGAVKVVDFGIAKAAVNVATTRAGSVKGKYAYMAPEQLTAQALDARADLYAVGVLLYELLSGQRPYHATSEPGLIRAILQDEVTPPREANPDTPPELNEIVMRAMARNPEERFASAEEMSQALEAYIASTGKTVSHAHIAALMKELFPDGAQKTPVPVVSGAHLTPPKPTPAPRRNASEVKLEEASLPEVEIVVDEDAKPKRRLNRVIGAAFGAGALAAAALAWVMLRHDPAPQPVVQTPVTVAAEHPSAPLPPEVAEALGEKVAAPRALELPAATTVAVAEPRQPVEDPAPSRRSRTRPRAEKARPARYEKSQTSSVVAAAAQPAPEAEASTGKVVLRVNPWAEVFFDGRSMGITPMDAVELPTGTQVLTLRNSNLKVERRVSVNVQANREVVLKADLLE